MNKEYDKNQKYQRKSFKKYRKYIGRILLWGGIAVASAFILPYGALFTALKGLLGESIASSATFFAQWGIVAAGGIGAVINAIKANRERKEIDNAQDDEENIIDSMVNENEDLKRKVESLEKGKTKSIDENTKVKTISDKEKDLNVYDNSEVIEKGKKYVK